MPNRIKSGGTPFQEAIDYFKGKVRLPTSNWTDVWEGEHSKVFVVVGAMKDDLLADFQGAIQKALQDGTTLADFRKTFDQVVKSHGWDYNGSRGWRTRTIYHTNLRQSHMAGRWKQAQRLAEHRAKRGEKVYLRYVAVLDNRTRDQHRRWHGLIFPIDHPFWRTHYPMNGWGCRCYVQVLTERDLKARGWSVSEEPEIKMVEHTIKTPDGPRKVTAPEGITPGFASNQGEAAWGRQISEEAFRQFKDSGKKQWKSLTPGGFKEAGRPAQVQAVKPVAKLGAKAADKAAVKDAVSKAIGGAEKVFTLKDGSPLLVDAATLADHIDLARSPFIPFLPELIEDPYEIWMTFERHQATGKIALRKRIIKLLEIGGKDKLMLLVADSTRGMFTGWMFIPISRMQEVNRLRAGKLVWGK